MEPSLQTPSRTSVIVATLAALALVGVAWAFSRYYAPLIREAEASPLTDSYIATSANTDTDGDGVLDWEEGLWGLNPRLADTDGDGTGDDTEIDALVKEALARQDAGEEALPLATTKTAIFARSFFSKYLEFRRDGELTQEEATLVLATGLDSAEIDPLPTISFDQIDESLPNTAAGARAYLEDLSAISRSIEAMAPGNEMVALGRFIEFRKDEDASVVKKAADAYDEFADRMLGTPVPPALAPAHRSFVETLRRTAIVERELLDIGEDPIAGLLYLGQLEKLAYEIGVAYRDIARIGNELGTNPATVDGLAWLAPYAK